MLITHQHPDNKSITMALVGAPNVGKSTLVNTLLGTDLSIVTNKPQTTRNKFKCILTIDRTEVILVDTPGVHKSSKEFNIRLNEQAREGAEGVDVNLVLIDVSYDIVSQLKALQGQLEKELSRAWLVLTKIDLLKNGESINTDSILASAKEIVPSLEKAFTLSAKEETNIHHLIGAICDAAPSSPHYYPNGDLSNMNERFFVSEYIREQAFELLKDELPYECAVLIDEFVDEAGDDKQRIKAKVSATIIVNRPSQRGIVVGSKGSMIKEIGMRARKKIEDLLGVPTFVNLHVKVSPRWFKNNFVLEEIGLPRAKASHRVWHSGKKRSV